MSQESHVVDLPKSIQEITIRSISSMVPINILCDLDGNEKTLTAYIDYSKKEVYLPAETIFELHGSETNFQKAILSYFENQSQEATRRYEEQFPPHRTSEFMEVPTPPRKGND